MGQGRSPEAGCRQQGLCCLTLRPGRSERLLGVTGVQSQEGPVRRADPVPGHGARSLCSVFTEEPAPLFPGSSQAHAGGGEGAVGAGQGGGSGQQREGESREATQTLLIGAQSWARVALRGDPSLPGDGRRRCPGVRTRAGGERTGSGFSP